MALPSHCKGHRREDNGQFKLMDAEPNDLIVDHRHSRCLRNQGWRKGRAKIRSPDLNSSMQFPPRTFPQDIQETPRHLIKYTCTWRSKLPALERTTSPKPCLADATKLTHCGWRHAKVHAFIPLSSRLNRSNQAPSSSRAFGKRPGTAKKADGSPLSVASLAAALSSWPRRVLHIRRLKQVGYP